MQLMESYCSICNTMLHLCSLSMNKEIIIIIIITTVVFSVQDKYVASAVDEHWASLRQALLDGMTEPLVLCGDGRNDSPGYSAQYCTYSLMDTRTNKIVSMEVVDSREADDKSMNMEKNGFTRALDDVIAKCDQPVVEIVTDQHTQIRALMSE